MTNSVTKRAALEETTKILIAAIESTTVTTRVNKDGAGEILEAFEVIYDGIIRKLEEKD